MQIIIHSLAIICYFLTKYIYRLNYRCYELTMKPLLKSISSYTKFSFYNYTVASEGENLFLFVFSIQV